MVLEAGAPRGRPVLQFPLLVQNVGQIRLFIAKLLANLVEMPSKILQDIRVCPQLKAIDRRVARHPPRTFVVMNDEKFPWMGKKLIQRAGNDHIHIQKQGRAAQAVQVSRKSRQLGPAALRNTRRQIQRRDRQTLHLRANALGVIGQANKVEITLQVPPHHGVQAIDIFRAVLGAPFHAQNVALRLRLGRKLRTSKRAGHGRVTRLFSATWARFSSHA